MSNGSMSVEMDVLARIIQHSVRSVSPSGPSRKTLRLGASQTGPRFLFESKVSEEEIVNDFGLLGY